MFLSFEKQVLKQMNRQLMSDDDSSCKCVSQYDPSICSEAIHPRRLGKIVTSTTLYVMTFFHLPQNTENESWSYYLLKVQSDEIVA